MTSHAHTERLARAYAVVDDLIRVGSQRDALAQIPIGPLHLDLFKVLRPILAGRSCSSKTDVVHQAAVSATVQLLSLGRHLLRRTQAKSPGKTHLPGRLDFACASSPVVFVCRNQTHHRQMHPVANMLRQTHGVTPVWLVFHSLMQQRLIRAGSHAHLLWDFAAFPPLGLLGNVRAADRCIAANATLSRGDKVAMRIVLWSQAPTAIATAVCLWRAFSQLQPEAIVIGNALASQGRLCSMLGRAMGIDVACLQHGDIWPGEIGWETAETDHLYLWGAVSASAVTKVLSDTRTQIFLTGAPGEVDTSQRARLSARERVVLVALSGPGDLYGEEEHHKQIRAIVAACAARSAYRWVFRLHPKDTEAPYRRAAKNWPAATFTLSGARIDGSDIQDDLDRASVVVTVGSTVGLEALRRNIPVLTLRRARNDALPPYVMADATVQADLQNFGQRLDNILQCGIPAQTAQAAQTFVQRYFSAVGEQAAQNVCTHVLALLERQRPRAKRSQVRSHDG